MLTTSAQFRVAGTTSTCGSCPTLVFSHFLDLISEGALEADYWLSHIHLLESFLRKWDCHVAHVLLLHVVD